MGIVYDEITPDLAEWMGRQHVFFVATAPLAGDGLVNCSPKGLNTFRVLGPRIVAYLDVTGSGIETVANLRENGRIVLMFCAFTGPPKIVRLHGEGFVRMPSTDRFSELRGLFPEVPGTRSIIEVCVGRISDSCGYAVPQYEFVAQRETLIRWAETKGSAGVSQFRAEKNACSLNGLQGLGPGAPRESTDVAGNADDRPSTTAHDQQETFRRSEVRRDIAGKDCVRQY